VLALALAGLGVLAGVVPGDGRAAGERPSNVRAPAILGIAGVGQVLRASTGTWTRHPTAFRFAWRRCNRAGRHCKAIRHASSAVYTPRRPDVGSTLRASVVASNRAGRSTTASSAHTSVVVAPVSPLLGASHLEYVLGDDGLISVYDMDHGQQLIKTISLPQTRIGIRGVAASPATHMLFISYGGDGGGNGDGAVLAYDLLAERVAWSVQLGTGIDSGALSPDGSKLYMPCGENCESGTWNVLDTSTGGVIGTIHGGDGPHNTIASQDGRYVYLGARNRNYLGVYETATGREREVGPLKGGVRPFTVNGSNTLAFTTATGFDGFQVSSITTGKVLFTVPFAEVPSGFPYSAPSHGISLSPDETQLYVIDAVQKLVQVYDVSGVAAGIAPVHLASIPVSGWSGRESPCAYDCGRDGWLQHSLDGRFVYIGDSGEVIDTATRSVLTVLPTLANTRKFIEIDWRAEAPVATSTRSSVGYLG
jgi:hypothetical protein